MSKTKIIAIAMTGLMLIVTPSTSLSATDEMWNFFLDNSKKDAS